MTAPDEFQDGRVTPATPRRPWSFTRLSCYADERYGCPRRYYYRYVAGRDEPKTPALERGAAVHEVIATCLKEGISPGEALARVGGGGSAGEFKDEILSLASGYLDAERPTPPFRVEEVVRAVLDGEEEFIGYVDLIEEGPVLRLTDFKTSWHRYRPLDTWQLALYAWMAAETLGRKPVRVRLWFLRYRRRPAVEESVRPENIQAALKWARQVIEQIRQAEGQPPHLGFPPRPGPACSDCGFSFICPR